MQKQHILLAGATGYLGSHLLTELLGRGYRTRILVRNKHKINITHPQLEIIEAEVTQPETLTGVFEGIDVVMSAVGITRQKDGLTYMDVDFQANANLIDGAKAHQVKKFLYVSALNGDQLRHLKIGEAKEKLGDYLKASGLNYCILRPSGFYSDMGDFLNMAKGGRVYLFGDGTLRLNPIHGADLAAVCVDAIDDSARELNIGGPELFTHNEIAQLALEAYGKPVKIVHLPDWIRKLGLWLVRTFTSSKTYGPIEFFMTVMVMDMTAPTYGSRKLADFFAEEIAKKHP